MRLQIPINGCLGPKSVKVIEIDLSMMCPAKGEHIIFEFEDDNYDVVVQNIHHLLPSGQILAIANPIFNVDVNGVIERFKAHYDVHED